MSDETPLNPDEGKLKHPWLAVLLSKIFPGAGHVYGGAKARGVFFIAFSLGLYLIMALATGGFLLAGDMTTARTLSAIGVAALLVMFVLSVYVLFDAYKTTKRYNAEHALTATDAGQRKSWLAAFLSSLIPGIGQFYNKQVLKGGAFIVAIIVAYTIEEAFAPLFIVGLLVYLIGIKDAFDSAETSKGSGGRFLRQEKAVVLFIVIMLSLQAVPFSYIVKNHIIEAFKVPSGAMRPTLMVGDHFLIGKTKSFRDSLKRGDIVVFPYPVNPEKNFVKRVIGTGGDKIEIIKGDLFINDQLIPTTLVGVRETDERPPSKEYGPPTVYEERIDDAAYHIQYLRDKAAVNGGPWLVPQDAVFVMGDNRDNSQDSRVWGPVPRSSIAGIAMKIYWSWDYEGAKVRWERIGAMIH